MRASAITFLIIAILMSFMAPVAGSEVLGPDFKRRVQIWEERLSGLEYVPDQVIVCLGDLRQLNSIDASSLSGLELSEVFQYRPAIVFNITDNSRVSEVCARLETIPGISRVEPNLLRRCSFKPNDALYARQEYHVPIKSEVAWDSSIGSSIVTVAVIDTGLDVEHPEFAGRIVWKENFRDDDTIGVNNVFDDSGHGTAVTGIIAAKGNNSIGIAGMAWDVRIMAFRACGGPNLTCNLSDEIQAIDSAVARGADVINLSLGGEGTTTTEIQAIKNAYNAGIVIVAAAGNGDPGKLYVSTGDIQQDRNKLYYPAAFPEVIGVAALDNFSGSITEPSLLSKAQFSNYGEAIVSVAAVGTAVQTTVPYMPKDKVPHAIYPVPNYARLNGTSFACPQVSGLACLLFSKFPHLSNDKVRYLIEMNAFPMGGPDNNSNGVDDYLGHGLINAGAALGGSSLNNSVHENSDFLVGISSSPVFNNDVYIIIRCKRGSDTPPAVSYFILSTAENKQVVMEPLPAHKNTYLGRFHTTASGEINIQVSGTLGGFPLESLSFQYFLN